MSGTAGPTQLYVGHTRDLGRRLAQHLECSAIAEAVAHVSIISGDELPGEQYRAAFKEDLVRRHQPKWNANLVGLAKSAAEQLRQACSRSA